MKKILILFISIIISISTVFAYTFPRWRSMPIRVYIPQYGNYSVLMSQAFNEWEKQSNGVVSFKYIAKKSEADIYVEFVDYVKGCNSDNAVGCTYSSTRNGFYIQNYIEIGTKESIILRDRYGKISKKERNRSKEHIYGVMLHEIGHALGLEHSKNPNSIMYSVDRNELQYLTKTDLGLLINKYR